VGPLSRGINAEITDGAVTFSAQTPDQIVVEINGLVNRVLMIFINAPERNAPDPDDKNTVYFGPGLHTVDNPDNLLHLTSGQTLYLAAGAVVTGIVEAADAENIRIAGRGVLHGGNVTGRWPDETRPVVGWPKDAPQRRSLVSFERCKNISVEGVCLIDTPAWTLVFHHCEDITVDDVKLVGYQPNSDGIDVCGSSRVSVKNSFIRTSDDALVIKCLYDPDGKNTGARDMEFRHIVIWSDKATALEIGHEECADEVCGIVFSDIDILFQREETYGYHAIDITNCDFADIHDVLFENIRVERCARLFGARIREGIFGRTGRAAGKVRDITLRNITCDGHPAIFLSGRDEEHMISDIKFENIIFHGSPLTTLEGVFRNPFVRNVILISGNKTVDTLKPLPSAVKCIPLDITPICNITLGSDWGVFNTKSDDWMTIPEGIQILEGIPFKISGCGYGKQNDESYKRAAVPANRRRRENVPLFLNAKADWLFFLQTSTDAGSLIDTVLCRYIVEYADGSMEMITVRNRNDANDWKTWSLAGWQPVFGSIRAYIMSWKNVYPGKRIVSILMSDGDIPELPILLAVTKA
jgi:hypothetical protein